MELTEEVNYEATVTEAPGTTMEEGNAVGEADGESSPSKNTTGIGVRVAEVDQSWRCRGAAC